MGDGYAYNFDLMIDVMNKMTNTGNGIFDIIIAINRDAATTLDTEHWEGSTKDAFGICQHNWNNGATKMVDAYKDAIKALGQIHVNYQDAEDSGEKLMNSLGLT